MYFCLTYIKHIFNKFQPCIYVCAPNFLNSIMFCFRFRFPWVFGSLDSKFDLFCPCFFFFFFSFCPNKPIKISVNMSIYCGSFRKHFLLILVPYFHGLVYYYYYYFDKEDNSIKKKAVKTRKTVQTREKPTNSNHFYNLKMGAMLSKRVHLNPWPQKKKKKYIKYLKIVLFW